MSRERKTTAMGFRFTPADLILLAKVMKIAGVTKKTDAIRIVLKYYVNSAERGSGLSKDQKMAVERAVRRVVNKEIDREMARRDAYSKGLPVMPFGFATGEKMIP